MRLIAADSHKQHEMFGLAQLAFAQPRRLRPVMLQVHITLPSGRSERLLVEGCSKVEALRTGQAVFHRGGGHQTNYW